jgi:hypothetical protein
MLTVESRGPDKPLVIGRSPEADVQVPVGTVSGQHCLLWFQDGQWLLQDAGSTHGTLVNGQPIGVGEAVYLNYGDVVSLGSAAGAPSIELDPQGLARRSAKAAAVSPRAAEPTEEGVAAPEDQITDYAAAGGVDAQDPWAEEPQPQADDPFAGLGAGSGPVGPARTNRRRPPRKNNTAAIAGFAVAGGAALIVTGVIIAYNLSDNKPVSTQHPPRNDYGGGPRSDNIFDQMDDESRGSRTAHPAPQSVRPAAPPATRPADPVEDATSGAAKTPATPAPPLDPEMQTEDWRNVESAARELTTNPQKLLVALQLYSHDHPGKLAADVTELQDQALDRLWWKRLDELCAKRAKMEKTIEEQTTLIAQIKSDAEYKKQLEEEVASAQYVRDSITEMLSKDMGFAAKTPPNDADDAALSSARAERDKARYDAWKKHVLDSIARARRLPWERT